MGTYITCGNYNNQYKYILLYLFLSLLNQGLYGLNYYSYFNTMKLTFFVNENLKFGKYYFIRKIILSYFGTFILACISEIYDKIKTKRELSNDRPSSAFRNTNDIIIIHEGINENEEKKITFFLILIIIFIFVLGEQALDIYSRNLPHIDFWMLELIIIANLNLIILKIPIFKHQKFVLFFSLIPIIIKIITIIIEIEDGKKEYIYEDKLYWIPLGLLIYFIFITLKAYAIIEIKMLMDLKYISANKLLIIYGLIGIVFFSIFSIISSFTENEENKKNKEENNKIFFNIYYSFYSYYLVFRDSNQTQIIIEIVASFLRMIIFYYINYNVMMIIKYLTPMHIVFLTPIFYFFTKFVVLIYNIIYCSIRKDFSGFLDDKEVPMIIEKFALDFLQDIFCFLGFLVYLEIIQLNFCGFNYNLRDEIIKRGDHELDCMSTDDDSFNEDLDNSINSENSINNIVADTFNSNFFS